MINIHLQLKTASQVAAAHSAGALGDAIRQEATSQEDASLASQESVQRIRLAFNVMRPTELLNCEDFSSIY